jgi:hypothetical protein
MDIHPTRYHLLESDRPHPPCAIRATGNFVQRPISTGPMWSISETERKGSKDMLGDMDGAGSHPNGVRIPLD